MIDLTKMKYIKRYNKNIIIFVSPILLLDRLEKDSPLYNIRNVKYQIGNRVERAKEFILKNWDNPRATFEPSIVSIYNNRLGFTDGRHRVLAAYELNIPEVAIEIPKDQEHLFDYMKIKKITESPDHVFYRNLKWTDESAYPFFAFYDAGVVYVEVGESGNSHDTLDSHENNRGYSGRMWFDKKIISFWSYPDQDVFKKIIDELEYILNKKLWNKNWKIECVIYNNNTTMDKVPRWKNVEGTSEVKIIPIEKYFKGIEFPEEEKAMHLMSWKEKAKLKPKGFGSDKYSDSNNIQKRQMKYTSENMNIIETPLDETEVRMMAWLYLLLTYNNIGIKEEEWIEDKRMGITFKKSIKWLENRNYIKSNKVTAKMWVITDNGKKALYDFFKPPKTREEYLNYNDNWLKKYNVSGLYGYTISRIPIELYEIKFKEDSKNKMIYTITENEYFKIKNWLDKYQRGLVGWWIQLNKYLGLKNELIPDVNEMVLYRGLNFNLNFDNMGLLPNNMCNTARGVINITDLKIGDKIICNKPSWTLDKNIAKLFASGKKGYGDYRKMPNNEIGVILKNTFPSSDILLDINWLNNNKYINDNTILSEEMEVIVKPKKRYVEVVEIFKSDIYEKRIITQFKYFKNNK